MERIGEHNIMPNGKDIRESTANNQQARMREATSKRKRQVETFKPGLRRSKKKDIRSALALGELIP